MSKSENKNPPMGDNRSLLTFINPLELDCINASLQGMQSRHTRFSKTSKAPIIKETKEGEEKSGENGEGDSADDDETEAEEQKEYSVPEQIVPTVPDGNYGWIIVFSSFMCNVIVDGIQYSFGVFLPKFVDYFHEGKGPVAWASSLLAGVSLIIGPIVSALTNKYGCRTVCIWGSFVGALAFALSSLSSSLSILLITYGFLGGIGFGLIYLPAVVCVGYYFDSKRALATGISVCGAGVGMFIFGPLSECLLSVMTWQNVHLVFAGLILLCAGFGMLMKPLEVHITPLTPVSTLSTITENEVLDVINKNSKEGGKSTNAGDNTLQKNSPQRELSIKAVPLGFITSKTNSEHPQNAASNCITSSQSSDSHQIVRPMSRKDIFYSGPLKSLPEYQSQGSLHQYRQSVLIKPQGDPNILNINNPPPINNDEDFVQAEERYTIIKEARTQKCCSNKSGGTCKTVLRQMTDFSLLKNPVFIFIAISNVFSTLGYDVPFVYIIDAALAKNVERKRAAFLLSAIGVTNTLGRVITGFISDCPKVNPLLLYNLSLLFSGICIACIPLCQSYSSFIVVALLFGLFVSGFVALTSIVLVDLLGLEKLTNAFGLLILFRGISSCLAAPFAGLLFDAVQDYTLPFCVAGGFFILASIISFMIPFVVKYNKT